MCFIHPLNSSQIYSIPVPIHTHFWISSKQNKSKQSKTKKNQPNKQKDQFVLCCLNILGCMVFHWSVVDLLGATLRENCLCLSLFLSQQLTDTNSFVAKGGILCPTPISTLGFGLAWASTGLVYAVTTALSSYV